MEVLQWGRGRERMGEIVQEISSINGRSRMEVKNSIGNVEAKELTCTTHGHELRQGEVGRRECAGQRGIKPVKWDNCNSIIDKMY